MTHNRPKAALLRTLLLATSAGVVTMAAGPALAKPKAVRVKHGTSSLRAQVQDLTALVRQLAAKDEALQAQVQTLQGQVNNPPVQTATTQAPPPPYGQAPQAYGQAAQAGGQAPQAGGVTPNISLAGQEGTEAATGASKPQSKVAINDNNHFSLQSADGRYSIGLIGVLQFDAGGYFGFHPDSRYTGPQNLSSGVNARRARIGASGVAGDFSYTFLYDAGNSQDTTPARDRSAAAHL